MLFTQLVETVTVVLGPVKLAKSTLTDAPSTELLDGAFLGAQLSMSERFSF